MWKKYLKSIKGMKLDNSIINIFTALSSKILICVLSKTLDDHMHTEMNAKTPMSFHMIWSTSHLHM